MSENDYEKKFESALESLRETTEAGDVKGFEHEVWSEITHREEGRGWRSWLAWLQSGGILMPAPAAAASVLVAVFAGASFGLSEANAYGKEAALALEQRYVESIHPVMMSASHAASHPSH